MVRANVVAAFVSGIGLSVAELFDIIEYIARDDLDEFFTKSDTKKTIMTPKSMARSQSKIVTHLTIVQKLPCASS